MPCGLDRNYEYIFIGSVLSATEISDSDWRLELSSEEVLFGSVPARLTVETNQGWCLPELRQGARWLFYIQRLSDSKELVLTYGSPSGPLPETQDGVDHLHRLQKLDSAGILRGHVSQGIENKDGVVDYGSEVVGHKIIARRVSDGTIHETATNAQSIYEFGDLPLGKYEVSANTTPGLWAEDGTVDIRAHDCRYVQFELSEDGRIAGHVRSADGQPVEYAHIEIHPADVAPDEDFVPGSEFTNERGEFEIRGLKPGSYVVSASVPMGGPTIYYPSTRNRKNAEVIVVGHAQGRGNVDFYLPTAFDAKLPRHSLKQ